VNTYLFHFSDGDNWSVDDTLLCVQLLKDKLLAAANVFCYGQVESPYGSGQFIKDLDEHSKTTSACSPARSKIARASSTRSKSSSQGK